MEWKNVEQSRNSATKVAMATANLQKNSFTGRRVDDWPLLSRDPSGRQRLRPLSSLPPRVNYWILFLYVNLELPSAPFASPPFFPFHSSPCLHLYSLSSPFYFRFYIRLHRHHFISRYSLQHAAVLSHTLFQSVICPFAFLSVTLLPSVFCFLLSSRHLSQPLAYYLQGRHPKARLFQFLLKGWSIPRTCLHACEGEKRKKERIKLKGKLLICVCVWVCFLFFLFFRKGCRVEAGATYGGQ